MRRINLIEPEKEIPLTSIPVQLEGSAARGKLSQKNKVVSRRRITYCSNGEAVLPDDVAVVPVTLFDSTRRIGNETALERA